MNRRKAAVLLAATAALIAGGGWGFRTYRFVRPRFEWKTLEAEGIRFRYPAHWMPPLPTGPDNSGIYIRNIDPPEAPPLEFGLPRMTLSLTDIAVLGQTEKTIADYAAASRRNSPEAGPVEVRRLPNGLEVHTWQDVLELGEIAGDVRIVSFQKPTGEIYSGQYLLPYRWDWRSRMEFVFWEILASIEFTETAK